MVKDIELKENEEITEETLNELSNGKGEDDE
jgi:DNA-binding Xre family transcriptional regulator